MALVISSNNLVATDPSGSRFRYHFLGNQSFDESFEVALASSNIYYSWINVGTSYNNNLGFNYIWIDGTTWNVALPNGNYTVEDLNNIMWFTMQINGHYLIDNTNPEVPINHFYLGMLINTVFYAVELDAIALPTTLPANWAYPVGAAPAWVTSMITPQFDITAIGFGKVIGFNPGEYPPTPQTTNYAILSQFVGTVNPVSSVLINCDLAYNPFSLLSKTLYSFAVASETYTQNISREPPELIWSSIKPGSYSYFDIWLTSQTGAPLNIQDPDVTFLLQIKKKLGAR
jgi:hypothetical protein